MKRRPARRLVLIVLGLLLVAGFGQQRNVALAQAPTSGGLFIPAAAPAGATAANEPAALRQRAVRIDPNLLSLAARGQAGTLTFNLFDGLTLTATSTGGPASSSSSVSWTGRVTGGVYGAVSLVINGSVVIGNINTAQAIYQIRYAGNGVHWLREVAFNAFPEERDTKPPRALGPDAVPDAAEAEAGNAKIFGLAPPSDGSRIDIAVFYSNQALTGAGSQAAMDATVDLAILETNQAYGQSGIIQRLRLVYKGLVDYDESGDMDVDLPALRDTGDGKMDGIHAIRNNVGADAVILLVEEDDGCGLAYTMETVSAGFDVDAFGVVKRSCATGNFSFGHELGHIMSAQHDRYVEPGDDKPFKFNHGYSNPAKTWRTIMAYNDDCDNADGPGDANNGCPRLQFYSNPDRTFSLSGEPAVPTGIAEGQPDAADNRKTLNYTAYTVANFRECKVACIANSDTFNITPQYRASQVSPGVFWGAVSVAGGCVNKTFTIKNTANQPFTLSSYSFSGLNANEFSLVSGGGQVMLQPQQSRVLTLRFCPSLGLREAVLTFTGRLGNGTPAPTTVLLHGVGIP